MINKVVEVDLDLGRANIPIFKGDMADFCKVYPKGDYEIADDFFTNPAPHLICNLPKQTKMELLRGGYMGLIHADLHRSFLFFGYYTGLPIRKVIKIKKEELNEDMLAFNEF